MRAVKRSKRFEVIVSLLAETNHPQAKRPIFPTIRELLCFAAVLGFEKERRVPLEIDSIEIDARPFENHPQTLDVLYLIALASTKDAEVLREENDDKILGIFEEYAAGGFEILSSWLKEKPDDDCGDKAILTALSKYGYLNDSRNVESAVADVSFV
jgi:dnd system-associated protein 4